MTIEMHSFKIDGYDLIVSYSDGISDYYDEKIPLEEFEVWANDNGKLDLANQSTDGVNPKRISFHEYIRDHNDWNQVAKFLQERGSGNAIQ